MPKGPCTQILYALGLKYSLYRYIELNIYIYIYIYIYYLGTWTLGDMLQKRMDLRRDSKYQEDPYYARADHPECHEYPES